MKVRNYHPHEAPKPVWKLLFFPLIESATPKIIQINNNHDDNEDRFTEIYDPAQSRPVSDRFQNKSDLWCY